MACRIFFIKLKGDNEMKDYAGEFEYKGKTYKLVFNLNVMEVIQDEYGSIDNWGKLTEGDENGEPNVKAVKFGFTAMINEAIDIENEETGADIKPVTKTFVGRMLSEIGIQAMASKMQETVINSTQNPDVPKNE